MLQKQQRRLVSPVQVVENQHYGFFLRRAPQEFPDAVEEPQTLCLRLEMRRLFDIRQASAHFRYERRHFRSAGPHLPAQLVVRPRAHVSPQRLDERPVRHRRLALVRATAEHAGAAQLCVDRELFDQPCLADTRLAGDHDERALARQSLLERAL